MYAVIKTGGKQYKVKEGQTLKVEKLVGEEGTELDMDDILMIVDGDKVEVGGPLVEGAKVSAKIKSHGRAPKINVVKFRRRKHYRKQMGHRQAFTELMITKISQGTGSKREASEDGT